MIFCLICLIGFFTCGNLVGKSQDEPKSIKILLWALTLTIFLLTILTFNAYTNIVKEQAVLEYHHIQKRVETTTTYEIF